MKIRSVCLFTWGIHGGAFGRVAFDLAGGFVKAGVERVYILTLSHAIRKQVPIPDGVEHVSLRSTHSYAAPLAVAGVLRKLRPDLLISMPAFVNIAAIAGWILAGRGTTKLIASEHATMSYKIFVEHRGEPKFMVLRYLVRLLYPLASGVVAIGKDILQDLVQRMGVRLEAARIQVIPNPVDIQRIVKKAKGPVEHPWLEDRRSPTIVSVGRLARQKNHELLLRAFALVREQIEVRLLIIGDGDRRKNLEELADSLDIQNDVQFAGIHDNPYGFMARGDLFVLSSEEEAFGLVLVEAMACGVPVVATDAIGGGPKSILEDGKNGMLVPPDDPNALAGAILNMLSLESTRQGYVERGIEACRRYETEAVARRWLEFAESL